MPRAQPQLRRRRRVATIVAAGLVSVFIIPIAIIAAIGPSIVDSVMPQFANTAEKQQRAELMRPYALAPDPSIDPLRAGEAFHSLGTRTDNEMPAGLRPATHGPFDLPAADTSLFRGAGPRSWAGPSSLHILELAHKGFSRPEMDYLALLARNPVWDEYAIVARASRMDKAGAMYALPFAPGSTPFELPMTRFAATKELAYASTARAAWHLASGRPAEAEHALRETISNGFRLIDDGNSLIDGLIGAVVIGIGRSGLEQLYELTANSELSRLRVATDAFDSTHQQGAPSPVPDRASLPETIADSTQSRGLRLDLALTSSLTACASLRDLMFGPPARLTAALATARRQLVRSDGEGALFDLNAHALEHPLRSIQAEASKGILPRAVVWSAQVPAFLLRNPRIANCAALVATTLRGG